MQSDLQPLGDFATLVSGNTPSKSNPDYWGGTTPWVSAKDMGDFWIEDAEDHLTEAGVAAASRVVPRGTVLLLARGMTLHKRVPICRTTRPAAFNQDVKAILPKPGLSARFLPYLLVGNHDRLHERVDSAGHGTGRLNSDALLAFPVRVPAKEEQEAIADIGEAIDDRIRVLRHTNATLESIAQAVFKSWYIDFDPVRAKIEGREPEGMDAATASLFPAEFENSALGLVPKGWRTATVADAVEFNPPRSLAKSAEADYLEMANTPTTGHRPMEHVAIRAFGSGSKFRNGDALLAKITPCLENGKSAFVDFLGNDDEVGWGSTEFIVLRAKPVLPTYGAYLLARHEPFRQFAIQAMTGTSGRQRVELSRLAQFPMVLPQDSSIAQASEPVLRALQSRIAANDQHAKALADLRDTLLPRLVSGKVRLPECQEEIREAIA